MQTGSGKLSGTSFWKSWKKSFPGTNGPIWWNHTTPTANEAALRAAWKPCCLLFLSEPVLTPNIRFFHPQIYLIHRFSPPSVSQTVYFLLSFYFSRNPFYCNPTLVNKKFIEKVERLCYYFMDR